jgi:site-specific recombinase XerD
MCLTTSYACGLRLLEGAHLQVSDVDSARMVLHVHGKGKIDRLRAAPKTDVAHVARILAYLSV